MPERVSVVIPALNEALRIARTVDSAFAAGAFEVIVTDGGSSDGTVEAARSGGARIIEGERMRARQLNRGAHESAGEVVVFLHADTQLPLAGCAAASAALRSGALFGGFHIAFEETEVRLRVAASMINLRTRLTRCPWGDQAQFIRRADFLDSGGFREIPIMEDYEFASRMKASGRSVLLPETVTTSGRRFLERGVLRTAALNWRIVLAWRRGVDPQELARLYRGR